jgi:PEP-CTERM motif
VALYPKFQATLDADLEQSLAQVSDGRKRALGSAIGRAVADRILALRSGDGSDIQPAARFVFGKAPGNYQSTPPNFAKPQITEWSRGTPFTLLQANQFRPGPRDFAVDNVSFREASNTAPEPESVVLLGSGLLAAARWRKNHRCPIELRYPPLVHSWTSRAN